MHLLAHLPQTRIELMWDKDLAGAAEMRARQLRGALALAFANNDLFHQHDATGRVLYRYPRVQYRWRQGRGLVVGWREAAAQLLTLPWLELPYLLLGEEQVTVTDALLSTHKSTFGVSERLLRYRIVSPLLMFNQDNYARYQSLPVTEQAWERDRLLIAQLLTALKGLDVFFEGRLYAAFTDINVVTCHYKQQNLVGIKGGFVCNAVLPDGFALGHATSHGYGWIACNNEVS